MFINKSKKKFIVFNVFLIILFKTHVINGEYYNDMKGSHRKLSEKVHKTDDSEAHFQEII